MIERLVGMFMVPCQLADLKKYDIYRATDHGLVGPFVIATELSDTADILGRIIAQESRLADAFPLD